MSHIPQNSQLARILFQTIQMIEKYSALHAEPAAQLPGTWLLADGNGNGGRVSIIGDPISDISFVEVSLLRGDPWHMTIRQGEDASNIEARVMQFFHRHPVEPER